MTEKDSDALSAGGSAPLLGSSFAKFSADGLGLVLGAVSSIITAGVLGPAGKGSFAALTFMTALMVQSCLLGLGDAAVVRVGQGAANVQRAVSASLGAAVVASLGGAAVLLAYAVVQLPLGERLLWPAVGVACVTVVLATIGQITSFGLYALRRTILVPVIGAAMAATTTAGIIGFCAVANLGILGATLAGLAATVLGLLWTSVTLRREGVALRARRDWTYLRPALGFGLKTQAATVLAYSSARLDVLLVYALASDSEAGIYSVALTVGTIPGFAAIAVAYASFPYLTSLPRVRGLELGSRLTAIGLAIGLVVAGVLAAATTGLLGPILGADYEPALTPALILLVANLMWGAQWTLCRTQASLGDPNLLFRSFVLNLTIMVFADLFLIPAGGATGAALGSLIASGFSVAWCLLTYRREGISTRASLPTLQDVRSLRAALSGYRNLGVQPEAEGFPPIAT
jgi:O-antigen/teichoic acid export membrane protein